MNSPFTEFIEVASENFEGNISDLELKNPFVSNDIQSPVPLFENDIPVVKNPLSGSSLETALKYNRDYMERYGWMKYAKEILKQIGVTDDSWITNDRNLNLEFFTIQFANWQDVNGIKTTQKGIFGLNNWTYFQKKLGFHNLSNRHNINIQKAISDNKYYEKKTWGNEKESIYKYLADNKVVNLALPLNDEYFAYAVADFQALNGLSVDGILGPASFGKMKLQSSGSPIPGSPIRSRWHSLIKDTIQCPAEAMVGGNETMRNLVAAIRTANAPGHYIYILGWMLDVDFCLIPNDTTTKLKFLLKEAVDKGVEVRALIWGNPTYIRTDEIARTTINNLVSSKGGSGFMILDNNTFGSVTVQNAINTVKSIISRLPSPVNNLLSRIDAWKELNASLDLVRNEGSHHEKVLVVKGSEGMIGFAGGIDINSNRVDGLKGSCCGTNPNTGMPYPPDHFCNVNIGMFSINSDVLRDVSCKVKDQGAWKLLQQFIRRWDSYKSKPRFNVISNPYLYTPLKGSAEPKPVCPVIATNSNIKVIHTFNNPANATVRDRSIRDTLKIAIDNAKKKIYFEDQYMISCDIADWLNARLKDPSFESLTILIQTDQLASELMFPNKMRSAFIRRLSDGISQDILDKKVLIKMLDPVMPLPLHRRMHSKIYIIDDDLAIIGSANCSNRSMVHDSETNIVIFNDDLSKKNFVSELNTKLLTNEFANKIKYDPEATKKSTDISVKDIDERIILGVRNFIDNADWKTILALKLTGLDSLPQLIITTVKAFRPFVLQVVEPYSNCGVFDIGADYELENFFTEEMMNFYESQKKQLNDTKKMEISQLLAAPFEENTEVIEQEVTDSVAISSCEGRTCWAKSVLNNLSNLSLAINNTLDEQTKNAISDFQLKNNIPQTRSIDAITERALLETAAIQKQGSAATNIITEAKTRIEDWTRQGESGVKTKPQHILNSFRDPRKLWAFVLHQMAFKRRGGPSKQYSAPEGYVNTGSHFCIMLDGRIIQLHPMSRMIWHGNCVSPRSVAVEFEGNFPNIRGTWWFDRTKYRTAPDQDQPTQAQYDAGKFLTSYLKTVLNTTHILAHRQSSDSRENDPGPNIWYNVGQWAIDNLGLTDGGAAFKCGTGNPILPEWRTWGNKTSQLLNKEYIEPEEETDWENYADESLYQEPEEEAGWENEEDESGYTEPEMMDESNMNEEDFFFEDHELIKDAEKAIRLNRYYAGKLGWDQFQYKINDFLLPLSGQQGVSLGGEDFAYAVAAWQRQQGLSTDGVIGPNTWAKMKPFVTSGFVNPQPPPVPAPSTPGTGRTPSVGTLGKLVINTSVPALSKSYPEYQFTSEDAIWLARFVEGEAGGQDNADSHAVIWAMFNRFGMLRHKVPSWTSFAVFLQKYSTTLQPLLNSRGAAERVWMNHNSNPAKHPVVSSNVTYPGTSVKKVQYQRHIDLQKKSWTSFPEYVRNMILRILTGQIPNPGIGIATDFDSTYVFLKVVRRKQGISAEPSHEEWKQYTIEHAKIKKVIWIGEKSNLNQKKNAFYIKPALKDVPHNAVRIEMVTATGEVFADEIIDDTEYTSYYDVEDFGKDWSNAIRLNQYYSNKLSWHQYHDQINNLLLPFSGQQDVSLGQEAFAEAVAAWQQQHGLTADGVIGPKTWAKMQPLLNQNNQSSGTMPSNGPAAPSPQNIYDFNCWHAQRILDSMTAGVTGTNFKSKEQLEKIVRGEQVLSVNPRDQIIQILPVLSHICDQAIKDNYREIIIGSFIRPARPDGACTGHCAGRCIDINYKGGNFETMGSVQMVNTIFTWLLSLSPVYKKRIGFGLPLQGDFFGNKSLEKFKSTSPSNLTNTQLKQLIPQLGIVFPDNPNHLHIQVGWL